MEIGSTTTATTQNTRQAATDQQQVRRREQEQTELETPAPQTTAPDPNQRVGTVVDTRV